MVMENDLYSLCFIKWDEFRPLAGTSSWGAVLLGSWANWKGNWAHGDGSFKGRISCRWLVQATAWSFVCFWCWTIFFCSQWVLYSFTVILYLHAVPWLDFKGQPVFTILDIDNWRVCEYVNQGHRAVIRGRREGTGVACPVQFWVAACRVCCLWGSAICKWSRLTAFLGMTWIQWFVIW